MSSSRVGPGQGVMKGVRFGVEPHEGVRMEPHEAVIAIPAYAHSPASPADPAASTANQQHPPPTAPDLPAVGKTRYRPAPGGPPPRTKTLPVPANPRVRTIHRA